MLDSVLNALFGCSHKRTSFPLTPARRNGFATGSNYSGPKRTGTYVVCLDCGKEFDYSWKDMRVGEPVRIGVPARKAEALSAREIA
jgi:hypothetical protein